MAQGGREELFFSFPNEEACISLFIDGVEMRGVFSVFDRDQCRDFDGVPVPVFVEKVKTAV
jgi:hypothetical protein